MRRFFECLIPNTTCNLKCSYCYLIQQGGRTNKNAIFQYQPDVIGRAFRKERVGGVSLISMTAAGETFLPKELPHIAVAILKEGHYINITTNGTLSENITHFLDITRGFHERIHISFSLHYNELKRTGLIEDFFNNVKKCRAEGCSILVQFNLVDEYVPYLDEIKRLCIKHVKALPQVALTRRENNGKISLYSDMNFRKYRQCVADIHSPLFDYTCRNFMKKRREFCYAGLWSGTVNMGSGIMYGCYGIGVRQNIFANTEEPIKFEPIGRTCKHPYCINSSHFMSQGIIPSIATKISYGNLRNREEAQWQTQEMKDFLDKHFSDTNPTMSQRERIMLIYHKADGNKFPKSIVKNLKKLIKGENER